MCGCAWGGARLSMTGFSVNERGLVSAETGRKAETSPVSQSFAALETETSPVSQSFVAAGLRRGPFRITLPRPGLRRASFRQGLPRWRLGQASFLKALPHPGAPCAKSRLMARRGMCYLRFFSAAAQNLDLWHAFSAIGRDLEHVWRRPSKLPSRCADVARANYRPGALMPLGHISVPAR